jgi:hypothetical protein
MCPIVSDVWKLLGIHKVLAQVCSLESEGGAIRETLLRDGTSKAPLLPVAILES